MDISELLEQEPFKEQKEFFKNLLNVYEGMDRLSSDERARYDAILKAYRDWVNCLEFAVEKGMQQGIEIGKQEEKYAVALNLKKEKVDTLTIARSTGLSVEEIEAL